MKTSIRICVMILLASSLALSPLLGDDREKTSVAAGTRGPIVLTDAARQLHQECIVLDSHNDLPWELRKSNPELTNIDLTQAQPKLQTDLPRLRQGGLDVQFWSVWVPGETRLRGDSLNMTLEQIALVKRMIARYPQHFELALTSDDILRIAPSGKIASLIGVEGGYSIEESLGNLRRLYELGARYMTLTHTESLSWADSGTDEELVGGLNAFGLEVVDEMNRLGMMVDLSHVSIPVMHQAIERSRAPVIFSHSSARGVADHPRNVPDDVLRRLRDKDGVVMVNFFSAFVVPSAAKISSERYAEERRLKKEHSDPEVVKAALQRWSVAHPYERGTIHDVLDHIDHLVKVAGVEHVGLGSDFDGVTKLPEQMDDVSCYPLITQGLLDRGYKAEQIRGILGGNFLRVMKSVERVAEHQ